MLTFYAFFALVVLSPFLLLLYVYLRYWLHPLRAIPGYGPFLVRPLSGAVGLHIEQNDVIFDIEEENRTKYGGIFRVPAYLGNLLLVVYDPDIVRHILVSNASNYERGSYYGLETLQAVAGADNLLMVSGDTHKRLRRIAANGFRRSTLEAAVNIVHLKSKNLIGYWKSSGDLDDFPVTRWLLRFALDCLSVVEFDMDLHCMKGESELANIISDISTSGNANYFGLLPFSQELFLFIHSRILNGGTLSWIPSGPVAWNLVQKAFRQIRDHILEKKRTLSGAELEKRSLFQSMFQASDVSDISEDEMVDLLLTLIGAGTETTSVTMTWTLWLLAGHPDIQESVSEECASFLAQHERLTWNNIWDEAILPQLKAVIQESMRLYTPVPRLSRRTVDDDVLGGYFIPKGTEIMVGLQGMHRSKQVWGPDAEEFNPGRTFPDDIFMPYGAGSHKCLGFQLATVEVTILLTALLSTFKFDRRPEDRTRERACVTLQPNPPIRLRLSVRE